MLHPVGPLPAVVYWRRRLVVLIVLLALLGGGGWLGFSLWTGRDGGGPAAGSTTDRSRAGIPELGRVVPSLANLRTPTPPPSTVAAEASSRSTPAGPRSSNDCLPEQSSDTRTLPPDELVACPVPWGGLTSEPTCTAARTPPAPGSHVLRGRLDTKTSADTAIVLG